MVENTTPANPGVSVMKSEEIMVSYSETAIGGQSSE
jgi:hypothetical protein